METERGVQENGLHHSHRGERKIIIGGKNSSARSTTTGSKKAERKAGRGELNLRLQR